MTYRNLGTGTDDDIYFIYIEGGARMKAANDKILVQFRAKDTQFGVTRGTLKALAAELGTNETTVIHMALSKFAADVLPAYEPDDGPLTAKQVQMLREDAARHMPQGKVLSRQRLFA